METMHETGDATVLLRLVAHGDEQARARFGELVYCELRSIAARHARSGHAHTLQPTALVHEAWLKLFRGAHVEFTGRSHFLCAASRAMRSIVVDHARARGARTHARSNADASLDAAVAVLEGGETDLVDLDAALEELARDDPELARVVDMRFFGGLAQEDVAAALGWSVSSVERAWRLARARLHKRLASGVAR